MIAFKRVYSQYLWEAEEVIDITDSSSASITESEEEADGDRTVMKGGPSTACKGKGRDAEAITAEK